MNVICKQAIYNREGKVAFYEIFLQDRRAGQYPEGFDPLKATSIAIDVLVEMGPELVGGGKLVFVNVPAIFLEASMFDLLSPKYVGIELVENKRLTNTLMEAIDILIKRGFKFCIDDFGFEKIDYLPLLNKCHFVKVNIKDNPYNQDELKEVISILKSLKKGIIAKNVESKEDYENALQLGFEYFQGIYLSKPVMVKDTRTISFLKSTIIKIYNAIKAKNIKKVVEIIEKDVGVTYKLLRFVNSAYFPKIKEFSNVEDAVVYLGLENVAKSATLAYALSSIIYLSTVLLRDRTIQRLASFSLFLGLMLNLAGMVRRTIQTYELGVPYPPWSNLFEALTFWSFVVGFIYLFLEKKYHIRLLGAIVVPLVFSLSAFAIFYASKDIVPLMPALRSHWLYLHVVTAFIGYAGFTVGFGGAVLYLLKDKFPNMPLPSKEVLDEITYKSIVIVFPIWTASIILGAAWANEAWGGYWSWDPKEVWALIVWLFFGAYLHARQMLGWKGKRTAWMVVFGFITVLICFFAVNLFFPGLHSYATD